MTALSQDKRYFVDQYGKPMLVKGDSPWALMTRLSPREADLYFSDRRRRGFNAAIVSLIGAEANGAPDDSGSTFDGLVPFEDGNVLRWREPYWDRVRAYVKAAAAQGITLFLYPVDGWTIGRAFTPKSISECRLYGARVGDFFKSQPNIVWVSGGDYFPAAQDPGTGTDVDRCISSMTRGIRDTGDTRPFSMQLGYDTSSSTDNPFWASRVDWNFVYTYAPTYLAVLASYSRQPVMPVVMGEANYEGENNQADTPPTTDETLRRQVVWALTSGSAGEFMGTQDWRFRDGWQGRLGSVADRQVSRLRALFEALPWWQLVPDVRSELLSSGTGDPLGGDTGPVDVLDSDFATAARTHDGRYAVLYLPTARSVRVKMSLLAPGVRASWVDPASGRMMPAASGPQFTTPGRNSAGGNDWILLFAPSATAHAPAVDAGS